MVFSVDGLLDERFGEQSPVDDDAVKVFLDVSRIWVRRITDQHLYDEEFDAESGGADEATDRRTVLEDELY